MEKIRRKITDNLPATTELPEGDDDVDDDDRKIQKHIEKKKSKTKQKTQFFFVCEVCPDSSFVTIVFFSLSLYLFLSRSISLSFVSWTSVIIIINNFFSNPNYFAVGDDSKQAKKNLRKPRTVFFLHLSC